MTPPKCEYHDKLAQDVAEIKVDVKLILALYALRLKWLERIVYGTCAMMLMAIIAAGLRLVIK